MSSVNITHDLLLRVHKTLAEMLYDRGYNVNKENELDKQSLKTKYRDKESFDKLIYNKYNNNNEIIDTVSVIYYKNDTDKKIGSSIINSISIDAKNKNIDHIIFIVPIQISNQAIKMIEKIKNDIKIEVFNYKQLSVNITKNIYVPKYTILNQQQIDDLMYKLKIDNIYKLPKISIHDPMSRYYGFEVNDVIRIDSKIKILGNIIQTPTYRLVIETTQL